jgi:hypothetical protein
MAFSLRARVLATAALVIALAACNPISVPVPSEDSNVGVQYAGPAGAWFEVSVTEGAGYEVDYQILVLNTFPAPRSCRDGVTGEVEECQRADILNFSDVFDATVGFRATVSPLDDDILTVAFTCRLLSVEVDCPASLGTTLRVVDDSGNTVGDLVHHG